MDDKKNIVLVGFMGTGKTATAKIVARRLEREFVDMDATIEQRTNRTISEIFHTDGEPSFRAMERALVQELSARNNLVVAAGGGVVINEQNVLDFNRTGVVVCLNASPQTILKRVKHDDKRPLLEEGDKACRIMDLLESRRALYRAIPYQVDTTYMTPETAADRVIEIYENAARSG
jgi:shikimate kinase